MATLILRTKINLGNVGSNWGNMMSILKTSKTVIATSLFALLFSTTAAQGAELSSGKELKYNADFPPPAPIYSDMLNVTQSQVIWKEGKLQIADKTARWTRLRPMTAPELHRARAVLSPSAGPKARDSRGTRQ